MVAIGTNSVAFLRHVIVWTPFLLENCKQENEIAETMGRDQELQAMSELHRGFFDWIFVKPSGAFVKY